MISIRLQTLVSIELMTVLLVAVPRAQSFNSVAGYLASDNSKGFITISSGFSQLPTRQSLFGAPASFFLPDSDSDTNPDILEIDNDADAVYDLPELFTYNTDHNHRDTDRDQLTDFAEIFTHQTNPRMADSDDDGMPDDWEVSFHLDPLVYDSNSDIDGDGYTNLQEFQHGTDPGRYVLTLIAGWNNISISQMPIDNRVTAIFGDAIAGSVWRWENGRFRTTSVMQPLIGYWVFTPGPGDIEIVLP